MLSIIIDNLGGHCIQANDSPGLLYGLAVSSSKINKCKLMRNVFVCKSLSVHYIGS